MPFQTVLSGVSQPWGVSLSSHAVVGCAQEQLCRSRRARPQSGAGSSVPRVSGSLWCLWSGTDGDSSERSGSGRSDQFPSKAPYSTLQAGCLGGRLPAAASWAVGLHAGSGAGSLLTAGTAPVRSVPQNSQDRHREQPCPGCGGTRPPRRPWELPLHPLSDPVLSSAWNGRGKTHGQTPTPPRRRPSVPVPPSAPSSSSAPLPLGAAGN